jgi:hypothetical protein
VNDFLEEVCWSNVDDAVPGIFHGEVLPGQFAEMAFLEEVEEHGFVVA